MGLVTPIANSPYSLPAIQLNCPSSQSVTIGASSTPSTAVGGTCVRLCATSDCWINVGGNPTATTGAGSTFLPAGVVEYLKVNATDLIAVIQNSAAGALSITPGLEL